MNENITVNGDSVEKFLRDQEPTEYEKPKAIRKPITSRHKGNTSNSRSGQCVVVFERGQKETDVMVRGEFFPWAAKAPYVKSGFSLLGAAEYCSTTEEFKCHECGEWHKSLRSHVRYQHQPLTMRAYRVRHGFSVAGNGFLTPDKKKANQGLANHARRFTKPGENLNFHGGNKARKHAMDTRRELGITQIMHPDLDNLVRNCVAQRGKLLQELYASLGRTPTIAELSSYATPDRPDARPLLPRTLRRLFGTSMKNIFIRLGVTASKAGSAGWSPETHKKASKKLSAASSSHWSSLSKEKRRMRGLKAWATRRAKTSCSV